MRIWANSISYDFIHERLYFVTDYYDGELEGYIKIMGTLHYFRMVRDGVYDVYSLTYKEKIACVVGKKLFEICVGRHWSYPNANITEVRNRPRLRAFFYKHISKRFI